MAGIFIPKQTVAGPPRVTTPFGIFSVLDFRPEDSDRWQGGGVQWEYLLGPALDEFGAAGNDGLAVSGLPKDLTQEANPNTQLGAATTFGVYGHFVASPAAWTPEEAQARALDNLFAFEEAQIETHLMTHTDAVPTLQTTIYTATVTNALIDTAIGMLEQNIAVTYGSLGVIYMCKQYAETLLGRQVLRIDGTRLMTALGTPVVAGNGIPSGYIKASSALFGYRSAPFTSSSRRGDLLDQKRNDMYAVAERNYLIGFDPFGSGTVTVSG